MRNHLLKTLLTVTLGAASMTALADSVRADNALVGPLFYTPLERDAIDRGNLAVPGDDSNGGGDQAPPTVLRFNGRVERSAGRSTAWVSGRPLERLQPTLPDARLRLQGERLRIDTPESTRWLKAGESFKPEQRQPQPSGGLESGVDEAENAASPAL